MLVRRYNAKKPVPAGKDRAMNEVRLVFLIISFKLNFTVSI